MPWQPLPRIAFAVATYPFSPESDADLPLQIGDELYVIEETPDGQWLRGYLMAPPSLLAGLTSTQGQTLEARVFSGIFPRSCVEVREMLGETDDTEDDDHSGSQGWNTDNPLSASDSAKSGLNGIDEGHTSKQRSRERKATLELPNGIQGKLSFPVERDPDMPRPPAPVPMLKIGDETPTSASEPLVDEIASCLREWHSTNLHGLLLSRQYGRLDQLSSLITGLNTGRQQFLHNILTAHESEGLREKTVWDLVKVNKLCGGEVIVRDPMANGRVLTGDDSAVEMTKLQSVMSMLNEPPHPSAEPTMLHHLLVDVKGFAGISNEDMTLLVNIVSKSPHDKLATISESFSVDITSGGALGGMSQNSQRRTLFTDLAPQDSAETELYLVVKILASEHIVSAKPPSRAGTGGHTSHTSHANHTAQPVSTAGGKSSRRSLMWAGKSARSAFARGVPGTAKMDSVSEQPEERPPTGGAESRDSAGPPTSASSWKGGDGSEGQQAQRTVGVGISKLNAIVKHEEETEQVINIWARSSKPGNEGDEWDPVIREIMESPMGHYEQSTRGERLQVHLKCFGHPDADELIKATPTMLSGVSKTNRMGFTGAPSKPRSDIYLTLNHANLAKQNLLSRYGGSATSMPSISGSNFQISLEVRKATGERIEDCIYTSSTSDGLTGFKSVVVERGEAWAQTVRLSVPPEDVTQSHVVMFLSDVPHQPFAVAYLPLWDQQAFIRDGPHGLLLYRIDEYTSAAGPGPVGKGGYLSLPWGPRGKDERSAEVTGPLAILAVETFLCSTKFSQDRVILGLLRWKDTPKDNIPAILRELIFVPEIEIVKLLSNVLDCLFGILVEYSGNEDYEDLVFTALIRVLGIVHDRRFNLGPLVDNYAENQFNYPFATPCLTRSFTRLLAKPTEPETARKLRATLKVVRHILKFITQSRGQQKVKEADIGIKSSTQGFSRHLRSIFKALDEMMRNSAPVLVGSQTLAVQHFHTWLPELTGLLTTEEILHIAIDFMDSCTKVKGKLVLYKLILIINYSKLDLFAHPDQRSALCANTVRWITPHWGHAMEINDQWREQIRLCCSVLASQMDYLRNEIPDHIPKILDSYMAISAVEMKPRNRLSLLFPTSYPFPSKTTDNELDCDETLAELSAVLAAVSNSPAGMQLEMADDDLGITLENLLLVHLSILNGEAFPEDWLSVKIYHHKSTMRALQYISNFMLESFIPEPEEAETFNTDLWKLFFTILLRLVGSPALALETYPEQKRRAVWKIAGDVRESGAELLRTTWEAIGWDASSDERDQYGLTRMGGYQVQYVPTLVGPIVELCLSVHEGLRRMAVQVLQTMIVGEWTLSEDLSAVQTEMIDCLDTYFKSKPASDSMLQKIFVRELLEQFEPMMDKEHDPLYAAVNELVSTLDEFLELLAAVHSGDNSTEATNLINRLRLMEFLRDMQKEEIFIRYVHQLADFQTESKNQAEAGLALRLHADLYEWEPTKQLPALSDPEFPAQTAFERKETLYFDMIKHFEEGESWSNALTAYKELQTQYETNTFDFAKLARTQRAIATIYETISKSDKTTPKYFRVIFKGQGFPVGVRGKEYIYEGAVNERGSGFTDRMQEQYPNAKIVTSGDVDEVEGQFLVVSNVVPHKDLDHQVYQRTRVPQVVRDFLLSSHPQSFSVTTKRITIGPPQEHYAVKAIFNAAEPFPTILRRSEILDSQEVTLSPYETALERIVRKTQEMTIIEKRLADGDDENAALLLDAVSVSVNPSSENSVACYRQLLPQKGEKGSSDDGGAGRDEDEGDFGDFEDEEDDDEDDEPELEPHELAIKMALVDHAMMLKRCLALFARSDKETLSNRHRDLQTHFESTFEQEIAAFTPPQPRDAMSQPWRRASPAPDHSFPTSHSASSAAALNSRGGAGSSGGKGGSRAEEGGSVAHPVSIKRRSTRLSFLAGKRKESDPPAPHNLATSGLTVVVAGSGGGSSNGTTPISPSPLGSHSRAWSRDVPSSKRASFFRVQSAEPLDSSRRQSGESGRHSSDRSARDETYGYHHQQGGGGGGGGAGIGKKASVRKRLSMLRLGGKKSASDNELRATSSRGGAMMGSLDEE